MIYNQYDIVLVNLDPTVGVEIKKIRPCVIISPNEMNYNIQTLIIAPMTSKSRSYPTRVKIATNSYIILDQIKTIDKKRVIKKLDKLEFSTIIQIKQIIKEMLVD
jgi:mRNA interferase MazF